MIEDVSAPLLPLSLFFLLTQKQQKHLQAVLSRLSQQDEQRVEAQQSLGKQLRSEAQRHGSLVQQLQQMVAERETKVKELEQEIQTLALKVSSFYKWGYAKKVTRTSKTYVDSITLIHFDLILHVLILLLVDH